MNLRSRLSYANVISTLCLFLFLSGGTAVALNGGNTVFTDDIANDTQPAGGGNPAGGLVAADLRPGSVGSSEVATNSLTGADVNESSLNLAAPPWRQVGGAGQPAFHQTTDCSWRNYDQVHSTAAFVRDATGFVHLKGTVLANDRTSLSSCSSSVPTNQLIFVLPPGYRPSKREAMAVLTANDFTSGPATVGTAAVDGPAISPLPAGAVSVDRDELGEFAWFTLNGISFRCAPQGSNGCP
jgi:hypothetical protein